MLKSDNSDLPFSLPSVPERDGLVFKEQVGADESKPTCETRGRPYLYAVDKATGRALIIRPDCKMWKCPHCATINKLKWSYKIRHGIDLYTHEQGDKFWFVTLTTHENLTTFEASLKAWRSSWDKLYHRMKRENPNPMRYVLLPELAPETGRLHAHMIINYSFGAIWRKNKKTGDYEWYCRWMKDKPRECGLGYMNDVRPVDNSGLAAWYVVKYVGKSLEVTDWPEHFRRVRPSVGWPEQPEREGAIEDLVWKLIQPHNLEKVIEALWGENLNVIDLKTGEIIEGIDLP